MTASHQLANARTVVHEIVQPSSPVLVLTLFPTVKIFARYGNPVLSRSSFDFHSAMEKWYGRRRGKKKECDGPGHSVPHSGRRAHWKLNPKLFHSFADPQRPQHISPSFSRSLLPPPLFIFFSFFFSTLYLLSSYFLSPLFSTVMAHMPWSTWRDFCRAEQKWHSMHSWCPLNLFLSFVRVSLLLLRRLTSHKLEVLREW